MGTLGARTPTAHPRACGENMTISLRASIHRGSSPRVRGKQVAGRGGEVTGRLIPARAGKTSNDHDNQAREPAHPRACGENDEETPFIRSEWGSSPRVRGKPPDPRRPSGRRGLIPARAGKTPVHPGQRVDPRAHPRACGENVEPIAYATGGQGSSPRVRGKHELARISDALGRLIPARAGKTGPPW